MDSPTWATPTAASDGMIFTVVAPNPRGFPIGTILNSCTVTLIEPDVALTAGHCVASHAQNGQPPWLRAVVTFDARRLVG